MSEKGTIHFLTPSYRPAGGVVKLMDYVGHARAIGYRVHIYCAQSATTSKGIFQIERYRTLLDDADVSFHRGFDIGMAKDDLMLFSMPKHYEIALRALPASASPDRMIHLIQGIRHVNLDWHEGYARRILARPASRISITGIVGQTIAEYLDPRSLHRVVTIGHDLHYFHRPRQGDLQAPVRVAYATWKSDVGDQVADVLAGDTGFEFRAVRDPATWRELRDLYGWADVFLSTPLREEGLYLPGLEAMSSGAIVVTPDSIGNMAYCKPGENCFEVGFGDVADYVNALLDIRHAPRGVIERIREQAWRTCEGFSLQHERSEFESFLTEVFRGSIKREAGATDAC